MTIQLRICSSKNSLKGLKISFFSKSERLKKSDLYFWAVNKADKFMENEKNMDKEKLMDKEYYMDNKTFTDKSNNGKSTYWVNL